MWFILFLVSVLVGCWVYAKCTCGQCVCPRDRVKGKTIVITGGNRGIGRFCSEELVKGGANLIIGCRKTATAENLKTEFAKKGHRGTVTVMRVDLESFASVRSFAEEIKKNYPTVDVLINNAGMGLPETLTKTEDNFEITRQTNYLSPFLLTHLLLPIIKRDGGRIVNVSSLQHIIASDLRLAKNKTCPRSVWCWGSFVYADTKLAMNYWTKTLATKLAGTGITVNCCHPGFVFTDIFTYSRFGNIAYFICKMLAHVYAKTPMEGAQPILHLVLSEDAALITGKYWSDCVVARFPRLPYKKTTAEILWKNTLRDCNVEDI